MKTSTLTAVSLVTLAALSAATAEARTPARDDAVSDAQYLVSVLEDTHDLALNYADDATRRGDYAEANTFDNIASAAAVLENKVENQILYPLLYNQTFSYVSAQLSRIEASFRLLKSNADDLYYVPYDLEDDLAAVDYHKFYLRQTLSAGDRGRPDRTTR